MAGFTKLHSSLATSSIMALPLATRWIWSFLLSQADAQGVVEGAVPGLAIAANVSLEQCQTAIETLLAPDPYSRTKDRDGRRLIEVDGGWQIVSYTKWRHKLSREERQHYKRQHQQARRDRERTETARLAQDVVLRRRRGQGVDT
jgi:hypothetical protein